MLTNQSFCLRFTLLTNQNTLNAQYVNKRSEEIALSSRSSVPFDIHFFALQLTNSDEIGFFPKLYRGDFLDSLEKARY